MIIAKRLLSWYPMGVEIPLQLKNDASGKLIYSVPLWYRIITAIMLAAVVSALVSSGEAPSLVAWLILVLLFLGLFYVERWTADPSDRSLLHSSGIWPLAKTTSIGFDELKGFRLSAFARGTVQGSAEEKAEQARAYAIMEGRDKPDAGVKSILGMGHRKPYIHLVVDLVEERAYLVDSLPARRAARLKKVGAAFAEACKTQFESEARIEEPR
jgi:hypothetical protein